MIRAIRTLFTHQRRRSLFDELEKLKPGHMKILAISKTGSEFAVVHLDDFDHLLSLARMQRTDCEQGPVKPVWSPSGKP